MVQSFLRGALAPAFIAAAILLLSLAIKPSGLRTILRFVALLLGLVVSYILTFKQVVSPWQDVTSYALLLPIAWGLAALACEWWQGQTPYRPSLASVPLALAVHIGFCVVTVALLLAPYAGAYNHYHVLMLGLLSVLVLLGVNKASRQAHNSLSTLISLMSLFSLSLVCVFSGSLSLGQAAGIYCSLTGVLLVWNLIFEREGSGLPEQFVQGAPLVVLALLAYLYIDVHFWWVFFVLVPAALLPWLMSLFPPKPIRRQWIWTILLCALIQSWVLFQAYR